MQFTGKIRKYSIIASLIIIVSLIVGITVIGSNSAFAAETAEKLQASINDIENDLKPGTILHIQKESYYRHGPASSEIEKVAWTMPENATTDYYLGPVNEKADYFTAFRTIIKDEKGEIVQTVNTIGDKIVYQDPRFNETETTPMVSMEINEYLNGLVTTDDQLLNEGWKYIDSKTDEYGEVLVFEQRADWVSPEPYPGTVLLDETNGVNIPYTLDLDPVEVLGRLEIPANDYLLCTHQIWIIDSSGNETLLKEHTWNYFKVEHQ